jgi:hypothetical protein
MPRILREIGVNNGAAFPRWDAKPRRQTEGRHAIDDAEIDRLGAAARFLIHLVARNAEDFGCGAGVNILTGGEGFAQRRHLGQMRQQSQFDLAVIGGHQHMALFGDEGAADAHAFLTADRDILQIRDRLKKAARWR